jgi:hypothetical protein
MNSNSTGLRYGPVMSFCEYTGNFFLESKKKRRNWQFVGQLSNFCLFKEDAVSSCVQCNEPLLCIECWAFVEYLRRYKLFMKDLVLWS